MRSRKSVTAPEQGAFFIFRVQNTAVNEEVTEMKRSRLSRRTNRQIGNETANEMNCAKPLDMKTILMINSMVDPTYIRCDPCELKNWQKEIMGMTTESKVED